MINDYFKDLTDKRIRKMYLDLMLMDTEKDIEDCPDVIDAIDYYKRFLNEFFNTDILSMRDKVLVKGQEEIINRYILYDKEMRII